MARENLTNAIYEIIYICHTRDGVSLKTPRPRGWVGAGRPSGCKSSFNKRNMYQYPHVSQLFILLPWQSRVYPEPLKVVEFVQLTTECCWGQPSDPCQRGCLTSHACVMWGPRTLNADDDDDDDVLRYYVLLLLLLLLKTVYFTCQTSGIHPNHRHVCFWNHKYATCTNVSCM